MSRITTKEQRTRRAIKLLALKNAGADQFLVNTILCNHGSPWTKLDGLLRLIGGNHSAKVADFDIDVLVVDGNQEPWSVLDTWACSH
jgi:hypothetical protein